MLMNLTQTAAYLGLTANAFRIRKSRDPQSVPPPSYQIGPNQFRWTPESVDTWLEKHCKCGTLDPEETTASC